MTDLWEKYDDKWTRLSLEELKNFAQWMNEILGHVPTIIGGWAVYFYNPDGLGSRDIDVIFPSWEIRDRIATLYLSTNGYELRTRAFGEKEWVKLLESDNPDSETYLDICTWQDRNLVHGEDLEIPWSIATRRQRIQNIDGVEIHIPNPEPLLVLKVKAAWDRNFDLTQRSGDEFLKDKIRKDRFDILSLLTHCDIDWKIVSEILSEYNFLEIFRETLERAFIDKEATYQHGLSEQETKEIRDKITLPD